MSDCRKCGWVHDEHANCACPPSVACTCCITVTQKTSCEDAPCCGCCNPGRAVMP